MGRVLVNAPSYIQEAAKLTEITSYTKEERDLLDRLDRAQQTRLAQDDYIRVTTTEQVTKEVTKQNSIEFAKSLLTTNMSIEDISLHTGLTKDEIIQLKE